MDSSGGGSNPQQQQQQRYCPTPIMAPPHHQTTAAVAGSPPNAMMGVGSGGGGVGVMGNISHHNHHNNHNLNHPPPSISPHPVTAGYYGGHGGHHTSTSHYPTPSPTPPPHPPPPMHHSHTHPQQYYAHAHGHPYYSQHGSHQAQPQSQPQQQHPVGAPPQNHNPLQTHQALSHTHTHSHPSYHHHQQQQQQQAPSPWAGHPQQQSSLHYYHQATHQPPPPQQPSYPPPPHSPYQPYQHQHQHPQHPPHPTPTPPPPPPQSPHLQQQQQQPPPSQPQPQPPQHPHPPPPPSPAQPQTQTQTHALMNLSRFVSQQQQQGSNPTPSPCPSPRPTPTQNHLLQHQPPMSPMPPPPPQSPCPSPFGGHLEHGGHGSLNGHLSAGPSSPVMSPPPPHQIAAHSLPVPMQAMSPPPPPPHQHPPPPHVPPPPPTQTQTQPPPPNPHLYGGGGVSINGSMAPIPAKGGLAPPPSPLPQPVPLVPESISNKNLSPKKTPESSLNKDLKDLKDRDFSTIFSSSKSTVSSVAVADNGGGMFPGVGIGGAPPPLPPSSLSPSMSMSMSPMPKSLEPENSSNPLATRTSSPSKSPVTKPNKPLPLVSPEMAVENEHVKSQNSLLSLSLLGTSEDAIAINNDDIPRTNGNGPGMGSGASSTSGVASVESMTMTMAMTPDGGGSGTSSRALSCSPQPPPIQVKSIGSPNSGSSANNGHQMMPVRLQNMQKGARTKASMKKLMQESHAVPATTPNGQVTADSLGLSGVGSSLGTSRASSEAHLSEDDHDHDSSQENPGVTSFYMEVENSGDAGGAGAGTGRKRGRAGKGQKGRAAAAKSQKTAPNPSPSPTQTQKSPRKRKSQSGAAEQNNLELQSLATPAPAPNPTPDEAIVPRPGYTKSGKKIGRPPKNPSAAAAAAASNAGATGAGNPSQKISKKGKFARKSKVEAEVAQAEPEPFPATVPDIDADAAPISTSPTQKGKKRKGSKVTVSPVPPSRKRGAASKVSNAQSQNESSPDLNSPPPANPSIGATSTPESVPSDSSPASAGSRRKLGKTNVSLGSPPPAQETHLQTYSEITSEEANSVALRVTTTSTVAPVGKRGKRGKAKTVKAATLTVTPKNRKFATKTKMSKKKGSKRKGQAQVANVAENVGDATLPEDELPLPRLRSRSPKQQESPPLRISSPRAAKERSATPATGQGPGQRSASTRASKEKEVPVPIPSTSSTSSRGRSQRNLGQAGQRSDTHEGLLSPPPLKRTRLLSRESSESNSTSNRPDLAAGGQRSARRRKSGSVTGSDARSLSSPSLNQSNFSFEADATSELPSDSSVLANISDQDQDVEVQGQGQKDPVSVAAAAAPVKRRRSRNSKGKKGRSRVSRKGQAQLQPQQVVDPSLEPLSNSNYQESSLELVEGSLEVLAGEPAVSKPGKGGKGKGKRKGSRKNSLEVPVPAPAPIPDQNQLSLSADAAFAFVEASPPPTTKSYKRRGKKGRKVSVTGNYTVPADSAPIPAILAAVSRRGQKKKNVGVIGSAAPTAVSATAEQAELEPQVPTGVFSPGSIPVPTDPGLAWNESPFSPEVLPKRRRSSAQAPAQQQNTQNQLNASAKIQNDSNFANFKSETSQLQFPQDGVSPLPAAPPAPGTSGSGTSSRRRESRSSSRDLHDVSVVLTDIAQSLTQGDLNLANISSSFGFNNAGNLVEQNTDDGSAGNIPNFGNTLDISGTPLETSTPAVPANPAAAAANVPKRRRKSRSKLTPEESQSKTTQNRLKFQQRKANLEAEVALALLDLNTSASCSTSSKSPSPAKSLEPPHQSLAPVPFGSPLQFSPKKMGKVGKNRRRKSLGQRKSSQDNSGNSSLLECLQVPVPASSPETSGGELVNILHELGTVKIVRRPSQSPTQQNQPAEPVKLKGSKKRGHGKSKVPVESSLASFPTQNLLGMPLQSPLPLESSPFPTPVTTSGTFIPQPITSSHGSSSLEFDSPPPTLGKTKRTKIGRPPKVEADGSPKSKKSKSLRNLQISPDIASFTPEGVPPPVPTTTTVPTSLPLQLPLPIKQKRKRGSKASAATPDVPEVAGSSKRKKRKFSMPISMHEVPVPAAESAFSGSPPTKRKRQGKAGKSPKGVPQIFESLEPVPSTSKSAAAIGLSMVPASKLFPYGTGALQQNKPTVLAKPNSMISVGNDDNQKKKVEFPSLRVKDGFTRFYRNGELEEVDADPRMPKEKAPLQTDMAVPWICSFCHLGPHAQKLGDLFGPYFADLPAIYGQANNKRETWMHGDCALWAGRLVMIGTFLRGLEETLVNADKEICTICGRTGATIGCLRRGCKQGVHYPCAIRRFWKMDEENFQSFCPQHTPSIN